MLRACDHLYPESCHGFEVWHLQSGDYEGVINAAFDPSTLQARFERLAEIMPVQHPAFCHIAAGVRETLRLSDHTTLRQLRRTEYYDLAFAPLGLKHQLIIPLKNETHQGGISIIRGGQADFTEDDKYLVQTLGRHVVLAHEAGQVIAAAQAQKPAIEAADHLALRRAGLSRRESEVLLWIAEGKRDKEIAVILGISYRTVTDHVRAILTKLGVETRTAAAALLRQG